MPENLPQSGATPAPTQEDLETAYSLLRQMLSVEPDSAEDTEITAQAMRLYGNAIQGYKSPIAKWRAAYMALDSYLVVNWDALPTEESQQKEWYEAIAKAIQQRAIEQADPLISEQAAKAALLDYADDLSLSEIIEIRTNSPAHGQRFSNALRAYQEANKADAESVTEEEAAELANAMWDGNPPAECSTFGPAAIQRRAEDLEREKTDPKISMWLSDYKEMKAKADRVEELENERDTNAALAGNYLGALQQAHKDMEEGYWSTRNFIEENVPNWTRGDDGPSWPMLRNSASRKAGMALEPTQAMKKVHEHFEKAQKWDQAQQVRLILDEQLTGVARLDNGLTDHDFEIACNLLGALLNNTFSQNPPETGIVCSSLLSDGRSILFEARYHDGEPYVPKAERWKKALEFYANRNNWAPLGWTEVQNNQPIGFCKLITTSQESPSSVHGNGWEPAEAALNPTKKE